LKFSNAHAIASQSKHISMSQVNQSRLMMETRLSVCSVTEFCF